MADFVKSVRFQLVMSNACDCWAA